ncbi:MAG: hypothetical protein RLZZ373_754 [Pseudomonadota bacterium]
MNLQLTPEQQMLQEAAHRLFSTESTPQRVRACESSGFDPQLWQQMVALGFTTMRVPESDAPGGMGLFEAVLVAESAGAHLASVPLAEALVAARLLGQLNGDLAQQWLARVRDGAAVVMAPAELNAGATQVVVPGGQAAEAALLLQGERVLLLEGASLRPRPGMGMAGLAVVDATADGALPPGAVVLAEGRAARDTFLAGVEEWKLLTAAALAGLSRQALKLAASYASERRQFDRAIGSFQGIAHPLADAITEIDGAQLLTWRAVWALAHKPDEAAATLSQAWWWAAQSAPRATARALHTFGGYGVSLEYDIQLYYRRARAWSLPLGDNHAELRQIADRLWAPTAVALPDPGPVSLEFGVGAAAEAFGAEVHQFFDTHLTPALRAHAHHSVAGYDQGFSRQLAQAGLLFPHWPVEFGGRGKNPFDMAALGEVFEEFGWERITAPVTNQVAQIVMRFGSEEVKQEVLPRFARGDALGCLGFSEPSSGCDVFSARTRAVPDGDHWIINGQKIFTTAGNLAQYIFLLLRTNPDVPKHKGLSIFLVPMDLPGVSLQPVHTLQDERTNITYLDNVRVHDRYRIGAVNGGIDVMAATLELEHGGDQYRLNYRNMLRHAVAWASKQQRNGRPMIEQDDVRTRLAAVAARAAVAEVLCHRTIWGIHNQIPGRAAWGPMSKVFSTEMYWLDANAMMDLAAPDSLFEDAEHAGEIEVGYRQSIGTTIYGGTSEIQRSLIAEQGLGLPRSRT